MVLRPVGVLAAFAAVALVACDGRGGNDGGTGGGSGGSGGAGGAGGAGGGAAAGPLNATTFAFEKRVRPGVSHLYTLDLATGQPRLLTTLDDVADAGTKVSGLAVSPDRRAVAFTSFFRPSSADLATGLATEILWLVGTDGQTFTRVTATTPDPNTTPCTSDAQCTTIGVCNLSVGRCRPRNFSIHLSNPAFSPDGQTLYLDVGQYWTTGTTLEGGARLARVPVGGGAPTQAGGAACQIMAHPAPRPNGARVSGVQAVCVNASDEGLFDYDTAFNGATRLVLSDPLLAAAGSLDVQLARPQWLSDGSGLLFLARAEWQDNSGTTFAARGLFAFDPGTSQVRVVYPPLDVTKDLAAFAVDAQGKWLVLCVHDASTSRQDLYKLDLSANPVGAPVQLTTDGVSCAPVF